MKVQGDVVAWGDPSVLHLPTRGESRGFVMLLIWERDDRPSGHCVRMAYVARRQPSAAWGCLKRFAVIARGAAEFGMRCAAYRMRTRSDRDHAMPSKLDEARRLDVALLNEQQFKDLVTA